MMRQHQLTQPRAPEIGVDLQAALAKRPALFKIEGVSKTADQPWLIDDYQELNPHSLTLTH
jgi:hypothetical protein